MHTAYKFTYPPNTTLSSTVWHGHHYMNSSLDEVRVTLLLQSHYNNSLMAFVPNLSLFTILEPRAGDTCNVGINKLESLQISYSESEFRNLLLVPYP